MHNEELAAESGGREEGNLGLCGWTGSSIMDLKGSRALQHRPVFILLLAALTGFLVKLIEINCTLLSLLDCEN